MVLRCVIDKICNEEIIKDEKSNVLEMVNILDKFATTIKDFFWEAALSSYDYFTGYPLISKVKKIIWYILA